MRLYFYRGVVPNFGDEINAWLWQELLPECWSDEDHVFLGIGTIITDAVPKSSKWTVLGSGAGYTCMPEGFGDERWHILAVRGPLTARVIGLPKSKAVTDAAILLSLLPEYQSLPERERDGVVFMPHHEVLNVGRWKEACERVGIEFLDPRDDSRALIERLRGAKLVIANAMHAAIVADTLRVPWIPVAFMHDTNSFKWVDWCSSMGLPYLPRILPRSSIMEDVREAFLPALQEVYFFPGASESELCARYNEHRRQLRSPVHTFKRKNARRIYVRLMKFLSSPFFQIVSRAKEEPRIARAAAALQKLTDQQGFLSSDVLFGSRQNEMEALLRSISQSR